MYKLVFRLMMGAVLICLMSLNAFGQANNKNRLNLGVPKVVLPPAPHAPMSPEQFRSTVNSLSQQTNSNLHQELQQQIKQKQQPSMPSAEPSNNETNQNFSNPSATGLPGTPASVAPATSAPAGPTSPSYFGAPTASTPHPIQQLPTTNPNPSLLNPQPAQQQGPYTGFGTGTSNTGTTAPASNTSGGWNIKY